MYIDAGKCRYITLNLCDKEGANERRSRKLRGCAPTGPRAQMTERRHVPFDETNSDSKRKLTHLESPQQVGVPVEVIGQV